MQSSEKRLKKSRCDRKTQNLPSPQQQQQKQLDKRTNKKMCVISLIFRQQPTNWYKCNPHNSCVNDRLSSENRMFYGKLNIQSNPELVWVPIRIKIVEFFYYFALPWLRKALFHILSSLHRALASLIKRKTSTKRQITTLDSQWDAFLSQFRILHICGQFWCSELLALYVTNVLTRPIHTITKSTKKREKERSNSRGDQSMCDANEY